MEGAVVFAVLLGIIVSVKVVEAGVIIRGFRLAGSIAGGHGNEFRVENGEGIRNMLEMLREIRKFKGESKLFKLRRILTDLENFMKFLFIACHNGCIHFMGSCLHCLNIFLNILYHSNKGLLTLVQKVPKFSSFFFPLDPFLQ